MPHQAILLPGGVLPAALAYPRLIDALGPDVEVVAKELEVYADDYPASGYSLDDEVEGVIREADARGWERFHLVGFSGGGASALAFIARHPHRLSSAALIEPAWAGNWELSAAEEAHRQRILTLRGLPPEQFVTAFVRLALKPGIEPPTPEPGDPPPWMAKRPAGLQALTEAFATYELDREALARFHRPVYFAIGALSNPDQYGEIGRRLGRVFRDWEVEVFEDRHHFDPPHRAEPERLAHSLRALWARADN